MATDVTEAQSIIDSEWLSISFPDIHLKSEEHGGLQLAQLLLQRQPGARVLYTTGGTVTDGMKALSVGGATVVAKPYTPQQLVAAETRALNKRRRANSVRSPSCWSRWTGAASKEAASQARSSSPPRCVESHRPPKRRSIVIWEAGSACEDSPSSGGG